MLTRVITMINSDEDAILMNEANDALNANALRAAFITIWLSCAESIRRRIKVLANSDTTATAIWGRIQSLESSERSIDKYLLDAAKDLGFLTSSDYHLLYHVYQKRCIYGHPYEKSPKVSDVLSAAETVVDIVLSRSTELRHSYLETQLSNILTEKSFLSANRESIEVYSELVFSRSVKDLHIWFLRRLTRGLNLIMKDPDQRLFFNRGVIICRHFIALHGSSVFVNWDINQDILLHKELFCTILLKPQTFQITPSDCQALLIRTSSELISADLSHAMLLYTLLGVEKLPSDLEAIVRNSIESLTPTKLLNAGIPFEYAFHKVIEDLESHDWYRQNDAINCLSSVGYTSVNQLSDHDIESLGRNILQAADGKANAAVRFLAESLPPKSGWDPRLFAGMLKECFINDGGKFRLKQNCFAQVLVSMHKVSALDTTEVLSDISKSIRTAEFKYRFSQEKSDYDEVLDDIDRLAINVPALSDDLEDLRASITFNRARHSSGD